jgi:hypothetical protein
MSTALQTYEQGAYLTQWREPEEVLAEATKAAVALKKVVSMKKNPVMFGGEQYLEREDWGTVAKFYGCTAKTIETRYVEFGGARGWEAVAVVIDRNMSEVGRAESMCLSDEEQWGEVAKYEWQDVLDEHGKKIWDANLRNGKGGYKSQKVKTGTTPKPLFQLRSMAATRAEAKALKGVFSWVVVLAGYQPTPAEEMTGNEQFEEHEQQQRKPPVQQPQRASEKAAKEADTKTSAQAVSGNATTTGSTTGGTAAATNEKEISGIIESAKQAKSGSLWITVKGEPLIIAVDEKNIDGDMIAGNFIKFRAVRKWTDKLKSAQNEKGDFWSCAALIELSPVQEGEVTKVEEKTLAPDAAAVADEMFGEKQPEGQAVIEDLKKNGQVTTASNLPTTTKPGTIGRRRAQRLYSIASQNKKTTGFTEENIKKVLAAMYPDRAEQHLSDLEVGKYEWMEKLCTGEESWADYLPD